MMLPRLVIGAGAGALGAVLLAPPTVAALADLDRARGARTALAAELAAPAPPPIAHQLRATSTNAATQQLAARLRALTARNGVLVESVEEGPAGGLARLQLRLSGGEGAVLGLAHALERGPPLVRLRSWRVEPAEGGVRLTGELVAPWS